MRSTSEAGSGHPTSCCSAADLMAALFFAEMRFDPKDPRNPRAIASCCRRATPRRFCTRRGPEAGRVRSRRAAEAAADRLGSRGPSDAAAAVRGRRDRLARPGHLRRDRHRAERAPDRVGLPHVRAARRRRIGRRLRCGRRPTSRAMDSLDNLCGITDVNALGQSRPTMWQHDMEQFARRWRAFGWHAIVDRRPRPRRDPRRARPRRARTKGQPTMILARTIKGKGVSFVEGKEGWHGRAFKKGEELDRRARRARKAVRAGAAGRRTSRQQIPKPAAASAAAGRSAETGRSAGLQARRGGRDARGLRRRRSPSSARPIRASSRSTPTSRTRPSATSSRRSSPIGSTRTSSPSR